jgi:hypothetical protein
MTENTDNWEMPGGLTEGLDYELDDGAFEYEIAAAAALDRPPTPSREVIDSFFGARTADPAAADQQAEAG